MRRIQLVAKRHQITKNNKSFSQNFPIFDIGVIPVPNLSSPPTSSSKPQAASSSPTHALPCSFLILQTHHSGTPRLCSHWLNPTPGGSSAHWAPGAVFREVARRNPRMRSQARELRWRMEKSVEGMEDSDEDVECGDDHGRGTLLLREAWKA